MKQRLAFAWLALSAITLISWWIGSGHRHDFAPNAAVTYGVVLMAAIKVRVIFREFMEVHRAPALLGHLMDGWLAVLVVSLLAIYSAGLR